MANYIDNVGLSQTLTYLKKYIDDIANTKQNSLDRTIWGTHDTGGDISGNFFLGDNTKIGNYLEYANGAINLQGNIVITGGNAATTDYVSTAIGALEIGGTNLISNSNFYAGTAGITINNATFTQYDTNLPDNATHGAKFVVSAINGGFTFASISGYMPAILTDKTRYTLTFWAKTDTNVNLVAGYPTITNGTKTVALTSTWTKYEFDIYGTGVVSDLEFLLQSTGNFYITNIKLEIGTKGTAWRSSLKDLNDIAMNYSTVALNNAKTYTDSYVTPIMNSLQYGERNLLRKSYLAPARATYNYNTYTLSGVIAATGDSYWRWDLTSLIAEGYIGNITISFIASSTVAGQINVCPSNYYSYGINLTTTPTYYSHTFAVDFSAHSDWGGFTFNDSLRGATVTIKEIMINKGTIAIPYRPAIEDIESNISNAITTAATDAALKYLPLTGGTITGNLTVNSGVITGALTGNADTATKLQTSRSLWGNSFDGTNGTDGPIEIKVADVSSFPVLLTLRNTYIDSNGGNGIGIKFNFSNGDDGTNKFMFINAFAKGAWANTQRMSFGSASISGGIMHIDGDTGNVGIGVIPSGYKLDVNGNGNFNGSLNTGLLNVNVNNTWLSPSKMQIGRIDATVYTDKACIGVTNGNLHLDSYQGKDIFLNYYVNGSTTDNAVVITNTGSLCIGTVSNDYKLNVNGNGHFAGPVDVGGVLQLSNSGLKFADNAFGGGGDIAKMYLATKGGEATTMTFEVENDSDDTINFITPSSTGLTHNNNIILDTGNYSNYALPLSGGTLTGVIKSNFASNTWINGVTNACLTGNYAGYGAIFNAPVKDGRISLSTYPSSDNFLYFGFATTAQITAGTNSFNSQIVFDMANSTITATTFKGTLSGNANTSTYPLGFTGSTSSWSWGHLTTANGYSQIIDWVDGLGGDIAFADNGGQLSVQTDGAFWQREGQYMCLDSGNYLDYAVARTSAQRPGVTRLYRRDDDTNYSVQTYWTGNYWYLQGYNGDTYHAGVQVDRALSAASADNSNTSTWLSNNSALQYGASGLQYFYAAGLNTSNSPSANSAPDSNWWHIIRMNHANGGGYYADLAFALNNSQDAPYFRIVVNGSVARGWSKFITSDNIGSQSVSAATKLTGPAHTNGTDGWFRSDGVCGWYNETFAGGIYMNDSNWIRTYNGKNFYCDNQLRGHTISTETNITLDNHTTGNYGIYATMADNDGWYIQGEAASSNNSGLRIGTYDDSNEYIAVSQGGSNTSYTRTAYLLDSNGNTSFPGSLTVAGSLNVSENMDVKGQLSCNDDFSVDGYTRLGGVSISSGLDLSGGAAGGVGLQVGLYNGGSPSSPTLISKMDNVVLLMSPGTYILPLMGYSDADDGHMIMIKRMYSGGNTADVMPNSYVAIVYDSGIVSTQLSINNMMESMTLIYCRKLKLNGYTGIWVQWKNPRDW